MEKITQKEINFISYPLGNFEAVNRKVAKIAKSINFKFGFTMEREINHTLSLQAKFDGYLFRNELTGDSRFDMEENVSLNWKITDKIVFSNIFDYNDIKDKKYYKFKVGIEFSL